MKLAGLGLQFLTAVLHMECVIAEAFIEFRSVTGRQMLLIGQMCSVQRDAWGYGVYREQSIGSMQINSSST